MRKPHVMREPSRSTGVLNLNVPSHALALASFPGLILLRDLGKAPYDDSFFFKRVAENAVDHGVMAFNVADGPVYGNTSQLFQGVVTILTALAPSHVTLAVKFLSAACVMGLAVQLLRFMGRVSRHKRDGALLIALVVGCPLVLTTVSSGMETALCLLLLATALVSLVEDGFSRPGVAVLWTGLLYLCRPDAALIPFSVYVLSAGPERRAVRAYLFGVVLTMSVLLGAFFFFYYGSALPLSFVAKTHGLSPYGNNMLSLGVGQKIQHFSLVLAFCAPLLWIACYERTRTVRALLFSTWAFFGYHLLLTQEIMGYHGRFYLPGLVPLTMAAASSWDSFVERTTHRSRAFFLGLWLVAMSLGRVSGVLPGSFGTTGLPAIAYAGGIVLFGVLSLTRRDRAGGRLLVFGLVFVGLSLAIERPFALSGPFSDEAFVRRYAEQVTSFRGLSTLRRCFPRLAQVYHSEVGVVGLTFPEARIVDLAGIQSEPSSFEHNCRRDRPGAIFLPHSNYVDLRSDIEESPCFRNYERVVQDSSSPLYLRRDLVPGFFACAAQDLVSFDPSLRSE